MKINKTTHPGSKETVPSMNLEIPLDRTDALTIANVPEIGSAPKIIIAPEKVGAKPRRQ